MYVLNTWMLILKYLKLDRIISSQQAVSGATSNIDTGGGGGAFNTKKEMRQFILSLLVVITLLSGLYLHRFNKNHPSNICYEISKPQFSFWISLKSYDRSIKTAWRRLELTLSYYGEILIEDSSKEFNGTGHRLIADTLESWLQRFSRQIIFSWNLCYEYFWLILTWAWNRGHGRIIVSSHCVRG